MGGLVYRSRDVVVGVSPPDSIGRYTATVKFLVDPRADADRNSPAAIAERRRQSWKAAGRKAAKRKAIKASYRRQKRAARESKPKMLFSGPPLYCFSVVVGRSPGGAA